MSKKDFSNVTADLSALAATLPTQRTSAVAAVPALPLVKTPAPPKPKNEPVTQFSLSLRKDLRKQLSRLADDAEMTMRAFVLDALKAKGLDVRDDDLVDLRKERHEVG